MQRFLFYLKQSGTGCDEFSTVATFFIWAAVHPMLNVAQDVARRTNLKTQVRQAGAHLQYSLRLYLHKLVKRRLTLFRTFAAPFPNITKGSSSACLFSNTYVGSARSLAVEDAYYHEPNLHQYLESA